MIDGRPLRWGRRERRHLEAVLVRSSMRDAACAVDRRAKDYAKWMEVIWLVRSVSRALRAWNGGRLRLSDTRE